MASAWIFPTSIYGQLSDVYGTAITQYNTAPNTTGFPPGAGLILGQRGLLFDFTETTLCSIGSGGCAQFSALTYTIALGNAFSSLVTTTTVNTIPIVAIADRSGATALVQNNYAWCTTRGLASSLVLTGKTAPAFLVSSGTAGTLTGATPGTSSQANIFLLSTTTSTTNWPVQIV
jgi:hypothetical protein